ncbi:MAG TPA: molybdopterin dinucleotide binding domain-containing protein [Solirubrobacterales bacterium]|nr:molybdopterin dinucleotide binding domain-containing protein [Solirubrobacterales bacterium]
MGDQGRPGAVPGTLSATPPGETGTDAAESGGVASRGLPPAAPDPTASSGAILLRGYRELWAGVVTERNPALAFLKPAQRLELAPADAERLSLRQGDHVEVSPGGEPGDESVMARVLVRERMRPGVAFMAEGTAANNANLVAGAAPRPIEIRKVAAPPEPDAPDTASGGAPGSATGAPAEAAGASGAAVQLKVEKVQAS